MLEETEPFRSLLCLLKLYGYWKPNSMSRNHMISAVLTFTFVYLMAMIILSLLFTRTNNIDEIAKIVTFDCTAFVTIGYTASFMLLNGQIQSLTDDLNAEFGRNPKLRKCISETCKKLTKSEIKKWCLSMFCTMYGVFGPLITGRLLLPAYTLALSTNANNTFFIITWFHQSFAVTYVALVVTALQNLLYNFASLISAYIKCFCDDLVALNFSETDAKSKMIECVEIHQNCRRLEIFVMNLIFYEIFCILV